MSAACLHLHWERGRGDTAISWAQASGTWDSAHAVGAAAWESCDTCFLVSWP